MKAKQQTREQMGFNLTLKNKQRLESIKGLGLKKGPVVNDLIELYLEPYIRSRGEAMKKFNEEMVRGGGFEPPTPTVSR